MKYIVSIYIWSIAAVVFGMILALGLILTFLLPPHVYDPWIKKMLRGLFWIIGVKVEVEGREKFDHEKTYLFMANHVSVFDVPLLGAYIPNFVRGVEADKQHGWPLYGWAVKRFGNIAISRENIHSSIKSIKRAEGIMKNGISIAIMPEGHRTLDGEMREFKKLPFHLAKQAGVGLVPIGLSGLYELKKKGHWVIKPNIIKVKFGDPIPFSEIENLSVVELRDSTREKIEQLVERA